MIIFIDIFFQPEQMGQHKQQQCEQQQHEKQQQQHQNHGNDPQGENQSPIKVYIFSNHLT